MENFPQDFMEALKDETKMEALKKWFPHYSEAELQHRFEVYAQSVLATHEKTLKKIFKPLEALLGKSSSDELFSHYASRYLSRDFDLNSYGKDLGEFIKTSAPWAKDYPYVADFADFCWLWHQVFLSADLNQNLNLGLGLTRDSGSPVLFKSDFPVYDLWQRCQPEFKKPSSLETHEASSEKPHPYCYALYRKDHKVHVVQVAFPGERLMPD